MLGHLMMPWHLNIWKVKIWLSQERKELSKWNKKHFLDFTKQTSKNVADTTFKGMHYKNCIAHVNCTFTGSTFKKLNLKEYMSDIYNININFP